MVIYPNPPRKIGAGVLVDTDEVLSFYLDNAVIVCSCCMVALVLAMLKHWFIFQAGRKWGVFLEGEKR